MLAFLRRLACRVFGHVALPGNDPKTCLTFHCARCNELANGALSLSR